MQRLLFFALLPLAIAACSSSNDAPPPHPGGGQAGNGGGGGGAGDGQDAGPVVLDGGDISSDPSSSSEHEPTIAATADGRVAVAWISFGAATLDVAYRISLDDGVTWGPVTRLPLPEGDNIAGDPSLTADDKGGLVLAWGAEAKDGLGNRSNQHVFVATSPSGAPSFGAPVEVTDPSKIVGVYDQPHVAATNSGALVVTWMEAPADLSTMSIVSAFSADGVNWQQSIVAGPGAAYSWRNFARVCPPAHGDRVYMELFDSDAGEVVRSSDDGGRSWPADNTVTVQRPEEVKVAGWAFGCVADGDDVWALYGLATTFAVGENIPLLTNVVVAHSTDGGETIGTRVDADDPAAGASFLMPEIARDEAGDIAVTYYAGTKEGDTNASVRRTLSSDGGASYGVSSVVHAPLILETSRTTPRWIGDYVGLAAAGGKLYVAYVDDSGSAAHVAFYRTTP